MTEEASIAETHFKDVKRLGLWNNAIAVSKLDESFSKKLVESPDFLRYQFIGKYMGHIICYLCFVFPAMIVIL